MELQEYLQMMQRLKTVPAGSEAHELMHRCYEESQRIMLDFNNNIHTEDEKTALLSRLTGCDVDKSVRVMTTIDHDLRASHRGDNIPAPIHIGRNVWIGANVTILGGVAIVENAVVAAGAVVTKDVAPGTVVGGIPAKFIKNIPQ